MKRTLSTIVIFAVAFATALFLHIPDVAAQNKDRVHYEKTTTLTLKNTRNEVRLSGVGKVIVKGTDGPDIRCVVSITGYGKDIAEATEQADNVQVTASKSRNSTPIINVSLRSGRYRESNCKVVTTLYLPPTVVMQHNEDLDITEFLYRILNKFRR